MRFARIRLSPSPGGGAPADLPPKEEGWDMVERAHMETDELRQKLLTMSKVDIYTPCVSETATAMASLFDQVDLIDTETDGMDHPRRVMVVPDVHTLRGVETHAYELVGAMKYTIDAGVCLVFMPSRVSAERVASLFPYTSSPGNPMYYIYQSSSSEAKFRRPCFVFGGPEMDAWESDDVCHVIDSGRVYRRHSMMDWSMLPIGRARYASRRRRAEESYQIMLDPSCIVDNEFTSFPDMWDRLVRSSPNIATAAVLLDLLNACGPNARELFEVFERHRPSFATIRSTLRAHGYMGGFSTTRVDWETARGVLVNVLPRYDALSFDTAIVSGGSQLRVENGGLVKGSCGVYARSIGGKLVGYIATGLSSKTSIRRTVDVRGLYGIGRLRYTLDPMGVKVNLHRSIGTLALTAFDPEVVERVVECVDDLRQSSVEHTRVLALTRKLGIRVAAGMAFRGIVKSSVAAVAAYKRFDARVGRLLAQSKGWFMEEGAFIFDDTDEYLRFSDVLHANDIKPRCIFTKRNAIGLFRVCDIHVRWYDGVNTGCALVDGVEKRLESDTWDEIDVAKQLGVDKSSVRVTRAVRRISRTIPGLTEFHEIKRCGTTCSAIIKGVSFTRMEELRDLIPQFDDVVKQPVRATAYLRIEGDGYGNLPFQAHILSWGLWDDVPSSQDVFMRLDYVDQGTNSTHVLPCHKLEPLKLKSYVSECEICFEQVPLHVLGVCGCRRFCVSCLQKYVDTVLDEFREHVACPSTDCGRPVHIADIVALAHPDTLSRYCKALGSVVATRFKDILTECPGKCGGFSSSALHTFMCDTCVTEWCLTCYREHKVQRMAHPGFCSSEGSSDWAELQRQAKEAGLVPCPSCETPYDKNGGCRHVTCVAPRCQTHFCWGCGVAFSNTSTSPDATARILDITDGIAHLEVERATWCPQGGVVPVPETGFATLDASRMRFVEGREDMVLYPTYIYEHMEVCSKAKE